LATDDEDAHPILLGRVLHTLKCISHAKGISMVMADQIMVTYYRAVFSRIKQAESHFWNGIIGIPTILIPVYMFLTYHQQFLAWRKP
jgi:hypothetical protein